MLANVADDPTFIKRMITGDETWVYEYDVETAQQSSEWRAKNEPKPKKPSQSRSKIKVMLIVFFDYCDVVHHEFILEGQTSSYEEIRKVDDEGIDESNIAETELEREECSNDANESDDCDEDNINTSDITLNKMCSDSSNYMDLFIKTKAEFPNGTREPALGYKGERGERTGAHGLNDGPREGPAKFSDGPFAAPKCSHSSSSGDLLGDAIVRD
ncbi:hypothetical protein NQ318_012216 [Aromia moschata]|uniref:Uncharacterized protein n=1 Tax=Aromia moschata TaxID=1265417 RepID=A0AAV8YLR7_9CUCU|nr:hypothetical protein NQ318_012216 [Aromia moschata]